jgi:hypothetical protein
MTFYYVSRAQNIISVKKDIIYKHAVLCFWLSIGNAIVNCTLNKHKHQPTYINNFLRPYSQWLIYIYICSAIYLNAYCTINFDNIYINSVLRQSTVDCQPINIFVFFFDTWYIMINAAPFRHLPTSK